MKRRRTLIISLLLVAALALGIGYAALSVDLTVSGSVTNSPHPIDVVYKSGAITDGNDAAKTASNIVCTEGAQSATFSAAGLVHADDTVTATFTVINRNQYKVTLAAPTVTSNSNSAYYAVSTQLPDNATSVEVPAGETATFTVTVKMLKNTAEIRNGDFLISRR